MIETLKLNLIVDIIKLWMESTNIYIPQFSDLFWKMKLDSPKHPDSWKLESVESVKNPENLPYGIWDWYKYNRNYADLLKELGINEMTNLQIYQEFSKCYGDIDLTFTNIKQYIEEFDHVHSSVNDNKNDFLELK